MNATIGKKDGSIMSNTKQEPSFEEISNILEIIDNELVWKKKVAQRVKIGDIAGYLNSNSGYRQVTINNCLYMVHRIMYILYHNVSLNKNMQIDHIDKNRSNNSKDNLRLVTNRQNQLNTTIQSKHPNLVEYNPGRFTIRFKINNKQRCFGTYPLEEATIKRDIILAELNKMELEAINDPE